MMSNRMSRRLILPAGMWLVSVLPAAFAGQSLVLTPGRTGSFTFPSVAAFTSLGAYRMEARLHDFTLPGAQTQVWAVNHWGSIATLVLRPGQICVENWQDSLDWGSRACLDATGRTDVVLRVQRNPEKMWYSLEMWDVATGAYTVRTCGPQGPHCTINKATMVSWAVSGQLGGDNTAARLAWFKLHSSLVALNARPPLASDPANLADWGFEGNLADSGPHRSNVSFSNATYAATPNYAPVCHAGTQRSFRAGAPASLDGSASYALDDGAGLQHRWEKISGPSEVFWEGSNAVAAPTVNGLVFGTYEFELKVQDSSGASSSCRVRHGAVVTDDNGVVIFPDEKLSTVFGPMIQWGKSPWPYYDERHKALADFFAKLQDTDYLPVWNDALAGTITATNGSKTITGAGTSLATEFCGGGAAPVRGIAMIIWYPTTGGKSGRRLYEVESCQSETQITLQRTYTTTATASGLNFAKMTESQQGAWYNGSTNANYYDNVMAFYALYYRSGIDTYLDYARTLADRWWTMPLVDEGRSCNDLWPGGVNCLAPRVRSYTGLLLRAWDGRPEIITGLRYWWKVDQWGINWTPVGDLREEAYSLYNVSLCGLFNPDAAEKEACIAALNGALAAKWIPLQQPGGNWIVNSSGPASWRGYAGTATVTNGSRTVIGVGTNWTSAMCGPNPTDAVWFTQSASDKVNGDPVWYHPTCVSATEITLDRPYEGATASGKGWQFGGGVGWGTQPFMQGIAGVAMHYVYLATGNATARQLVSDSATWIWTTGYRPSTKGLYYYRGFINCEPIMEGHPACSADDLQASRAYSGEVTRNFSFAYQHTGNETFLTAEDTMHGAAYGKLGGPNTDAYYVSELEGWTIGTKKAKDFGFHFGFGGGWSWPAARLGGPAPPSARTRWILARPANVPQSSGVRLALTAPSGKTIETSCASSPCSVVEDGRQGEYLLRMEYRSAADKALAASSQPVVLKSR